MGLFSALFNVVKTIAPNVVSAVTNAVTTIANTVVSMIQGNAELPEPPAQSTSQPKPPAVPAGPSSEEIRQQQINRRASRFDRDIGRKARPTLDGDAPFYNELTPDIATDFRGRTNPADLILAAASNPVIYGLVEMMKHERPTLAAFMQHPVRSTADTLRLLFADAVHYEHFTAEAAAWWDQFANDFVPSPIEEMFGLFSPMSNQIINNLSASFASPRQPIFSQVSYLNLTDDPGSLTPLEEAEEIIMAEYARILCSQSNNENQCLANINKEQLYLSIHGSHAVIRPVSVYSDPNTYLYQITCTDNPNPEDVILQRPNAFNRGNIIDDVYGPTRFRYNPDTGEYTEINTKVDPCAPKNLARTPGQELSRDNIIHERIGHSFLSAAGLGGNFTSSPMYQATDVLSDDMIIALFNEANIDPESIVEGGRQSQEIDREELLSDLIMLVATGVIEPPPGYGELMAQNIRQAIINRMSTEEYYELLYSKDVSIDELPTGNTSSRYRVIPRILTESAISETGQIVLNSPNYYNSLDESSQVTALGRSNEQVPDTSGFKEYWVYVEFNSKQRGWIRADLITGIDVEHLPEITPSTVDPFRQFDIDDPYNPSFEAALGSSN